MRITKVRSDIANKKGTTSVSFSPRSNQAATCGYDSKILIWDAVTWKIKDILPGHYRGHLSFSQSSSFFVSGGMKANATINDIGTGKVLRTLTGVDNVWSLAFMPTSDVLAIVIPPDDSGPHKGKTIQLLNTNTWKSFDRIDLGYEYVYSLSYSPDGRHVAIASTPSGTVSIWTSDFQTNLKHFSASNSTVWCVEHSPEGDLLLTGGADGILRLWDTTSWGLCADVTSNDGALEANPTPILCAAFSPEGKQVVTGDLLGNISLWQIDKHN